MLSAEERAVLSTPADKRTPAQKKLAKGLETSLRITWEEVAAAVSANAVGHGPARAAEAGDLTRSSGTLPRPPANAMALVEKKAKEVESFVLRRGDYKIARPQGGAAAAGRAAGLAAGGCVYRPSTGSSKDEKTGRRAALAVGSRELTIR